ncbi:SCO3242 family prenyltransferase [Streptomyces sp. VRA16 Mangrove soil]|uniref:SCO3242 family prenyltransferase n=1 Tax=Streptomyces sp. VRA16 Mangrove soil TaxID=2817434 RepID=UPI001A9EA6D3|nr:UbiA family prenyltransferase [Streptomyces sp. VRA16 Mangrove soil]MBO1331019.1 UbiA family prenyltransferase [Streptomyces sp. VRA16 Mangrove soil]
MSGTALRAWAELLRLPALFTVPGDALAGAAAAGARPGRGTLLAIGSSLCLYEAGMALNDWADRAEDAVDRPHRPIPSGRIRPAAALTAAGALTTAGVALAFRAGRTPGLLGTALAATVWTYDLGLKRTPAGPAAMGLARGLDLLLGSSASLPGGPERQRSGVGGEAHPNRCGRLPHRTGDVTTSPGPADVVSVMARARGDIGAASGTTARPGAGPRSSAHALRAATPAALALATHTAAVTTVSRSETTGGNALAPAAALATSAALTTALLRPPVGRGGAAPLGLPGPTAYAVTTARPLLHAMLNPSPPLTQRAVGAGIRAMIPLQAALAARAGAPTTALITGALAPLARRFAKKVSVT